MLGKPGYIYVVRNGGKNGSGKTGGGKKVAGRKRREEIGGKKEAGRRGGKRGSAERQRREEGANEKTDAAGKNWWEKLVGRGRRKDFYF